MTWGLAEDSEITEKIIRHNAAATRYKVMIETVDLDALRWEKAMLEKTLAMPKPSDEELLEYGKSQHPYFADKEEMIKRLEEIEDILGA